MGRDDEAKKIAFRAQAGMSEEGRKMMGDFLSTQSDWYMTCKNCNERIIGTIESVKNHGKTCK